MPPETPAGSAASTTAKPRGSRQASPKQTSPKQHSPKQRSSKQHSPGQRSGSTGPGRPVAVIMGSQSDWPVMRHASETLDALGIAHDARIVSAHRTPERLYEFARGAREAGYRIIIAGAGGAAHLPGMTAAMTPLPVFGVPIPGAALGGSDALYSIVQMPGGIPVGTLAIGKPGAINAALLAAAVLALNDEALAERLAGWRAANSEAVALAPDQDRVDRDEGHRGERPGGGGLVRPAGGAVNGGRTAGDGLRGG